VRWGRRATIDWSWHEEEIGGTTTMIETSVPARRMSIPWRTLSMRAWRPTSSIA